MNETCLQVQVYSYSFYRSTSCGRVVVVGPTLLAVAVVDPLVLDAAVLTLDLRNCRLRNVAFNVAAVRPVGLLVIQIFVFVLVFRYIIIIIVYNVNILFFFSVSHCIPYIW